MKNLIRKIFTIVLFALFSTTVFAQSVTTFNLKDGSSIKGKLLGFENQVYTVETENLGTITLKEEDVSGLSSGPQNIPQGENNPYGSNTDIKASAQQMQMQLMSDPEVIQEMQALAQDEDITSIISDPDFMKAVMSYDPNAVMNNENTMKLMENPKIQKLMDLISKKYMPQK